LERPADLQNLPSRITLSLSALAAVLAVAALIIRWIGIPTAGEIEASSVTRLGGGAVFVAPLPFDNALLRPLADIPAAPERSDLELFEDGRRLGPPHASPEGLAAGHGAYSHSHDGTEILFTTSDGSDPGKNRRRYTYRVRVRASLHDAMNLAFISGLLFVCGIVRRTSGAVKAAGRFVENVARPCLQWALSAATRIAWVSAGILAVWLLGSGLSSDVAAWAPLQTPALGLTILEAERRLPLLLLLIAVAGYVIMPQGMNRPMASRSLALVALLFCLGYVCSIYRPEPLLPIDADPYSNLLGFLPNSDAKDYYQGARRLLDVGELTAFAERRPANAAWLAIRLSLAGSLTGAAYVQVIFAAMACGYLVFVVGRIFGPWSGLTVLALAYSYTRLHFTTTLSEAPGITFGMLGTALVLVGLRTQTAALFAAGMSALGLAESFRAGALLAPLGIAAGVALLSTRGFRMRTAVLGIGAYCATLLVISPGLNAMYGSGKGQAGSNLSYVVAGLSLGGGWRVAEKEYASEIAQRPQELDSSRFLYRAALENVRKDPRPALRTIGESYQLAWRQTPEVLEGLAGVGGVGPIAFAALILYRIRRRLAVPAWIVWLAGCFFSGLLLSLPVIYLDGGWRVIAASVAMIFTLLSVLLATRDPTPAEPRRLDRFAALCPGLMIAALFAGPAVARVLAGPPETSCLPPGRLVVRHPSHEPAVLYEASPTSSRRNIPVMSPERLREHMAHAGNLLPVPDPPVLLHWAYEYSTHGLLMLAAPPSLIDTPGPFIWIEATAGASDSLRRVENFGPWEGCPVRTRPLAEHMPEGVAPIVLPRVSVVGTGEEEPVIHDPVSPAARGRDLGRFTDRGAQFQSILPKLIAPRIDSRGQSKHEGTILGIVLLNRVHVPRRDEVGIEGIRMMGPAIFQGDLPDARLRREGLDARFAVGQRQGTGKTSVQRAADLPVVGPEPDVRELLRRSGVSEDHVLGAAASADLAVDTDLDVPIGRGTDLGLVGVEDILVHRVDVPAGQLGEVADQMFLEGGAPFSAGSRGRRVQSLAVEADVHMIAVAGDPRS